MKVLIYVQHLLGIGHFQRMAFIAEACLQEGMEVRLISGGRKTHSDHVLSQIIFQLSSIHARDESFKVYLKENGEEVDQPYLDLRKDTLFDACFTFNPDLILIESYPFGRNYFKGEITPLLKFAKAKNIPVVSSVRDILVKKELKKQERAADILNDYFSTVLVHGDQDLVSLEASFSEAAAIKIPVHYTGYISQEIKAYERKFERPTILVSAGGGAVGQHLIEAVIGCADQFANYDFQISTGMNIKDSLFERFKKKTPNHVYLTRFNPDFRSQLRYAALSISQAGYNTSIDILAANCPSIMIPFETETETEQFDRARILAENKHVAMIRQKELTSQKLGKVIRSELSHEKLREHNYDFDGIQNTVSYLKNFSAREGRQNMWDLVQAELDHWQQTGKQFQFWWRDDDVIEPSKALDKMLILQKQFNQPLYLASIPQFCHKDLAEALKSYEQVYILQHGYDHKNHGLRSEKKIELGGSWPIDKAQHDLLLGKQKLVSLFKGRFVPILVPPWNRIDPTYFSFVEEHYQALSLFKNPTSNQQFQMINTQIDVIDWKRDKQFLGEEPCLLLFLGELQKRRFGAVDIAAPIGLLTHHLDHDDKIWAFLEKFLAFLDQNSALITNSPNLWAA